MRKLISTSKRNSLYAGYSYDAIRKSLKSKGIKETIIDHHFHTLRIAGVKPIIRVNKPVRKELLNLPNRDILIQALKEYINKQRREGFKDKDIQKALLHYGHIKSAVDASFENT